MRCTAGGAASTNRAILPVAPRRTRDGSRSAARLPRRDHEAAAEAHRTRAHVDEAGLPPRVDRPVDAVPVVVRRDVGAEEPADAIPVAAAGGVPRHRQDTT